MAMEPLLYFKQVLLELKYSEQDAIAKATEIDRISRLEKINPGEVEANINLLYEYLKFSHRKHEVRAAVIAVKKSME